MIVLIPAYQPDAALPQLVGDLRSAAAPLDIVVVDDGSGPAYRAVFDEVLRLGAEVIGYPANHGKGFALKAGLRHIVQRYPGESVVCADSDGQHTPADILRVAERLAGSADSEASMVLGVRRFSGPVPLRSRVGNTLTRWMFQLATRRSIADTQTGLRGYPAEMLPWLLGVDGDRYEYELDVLLRATTEGRRIDTLDIATVYLDDNASSHFRPLTDSARIYARLLKFSLSSIVAFAIDTGMLLMLSALTGSLLLSVLGARLVSSTVNFAINRRLVFDNLSRRPLLRSAASYFGLVATLVAVNYLILAVLQALGVSLLLAKVLTELTLFAVSYAVQRTWVFARGPHLRSQPTTRNLLAGAGQPLSARTVSVSSIEN